MQVIQDTFEIKYEVKKSTFLAFATPIDNFNFLHASLKSKHPKAAHIVWAYRSLNEFNQIVENSSDDGEPKGTSGAPILNVMRGMKLVNCAILVVRYFGGIKLGTGGLVRAYGASAKMVLEISILEKYEKKEDFVFTCKYSFVGKIEYFLTKEDIFFNDRKFENDEIFWKLHVTKIQKDNVLNFLNDLIRTNNVKIL